MSEHADFEALSAYVDGEAPEWAAHVAGCPACAATVDQLRAVSAAVGAPVEPVTAAARDAAVAAALDGGRVASEPAPVRARPPAAAQLRPRRRGGWLLGAAAAVVAVVLGAAALLHGTGRSTERTTIAGPAFESNPTSGARSSAADSGAAIAPAPAADLGEIPDAATLRARAGIAVAPKVPPVTGGAAAAPSQLGLAPNAAGQGSPPCEAQARARQPSLGQIVYFATARRQGVPAVVLGFSNGSDPSGFTLLLLAQDGCGELLRAVGP